MTNTSLIRPPVDQAEIEALMDKHDTVAVIDAMATVLAKKAEHLRSAWQDEDAAEMFDEASDVLNKALMEIERLIG